MGKPKVRYHVIPIYAAAAAWLIGALTIHFSWAVTLFLCGVISAIVYALLAYLLPPEKEAAPLPQANPVTSPQDAERNDWDRLIRQTKEQVNALHATPIEASLKTLNVNLCNIRNAISENPDRADNTYVRHFLALYREYINDLSDYAACTKIPNAGNNIKKLLLLTEERFGTLASLSKTLLDEIYKRDVLVLSANNTALKQAFAPLEQPDVFNENQTS